MGLFPSSGRGHRSKPRRRTTSGCTAFRVDSPSDAHHASRSGMGPRHRAARRDGTDPSPPPERWLERSAGSLARAARVLLWGLSSSSGIPPRRRRAPFSSDGNARGIQRPEHGRDELRARCEPGRIPTLARPIAERGEPSPISVNDPKTSPPIVVQIAWIRTTIATWPPLDLSA